MNISLDNRELNLQFTYGAGISIAETQSSLKQINQKLGIIKQSRSVIEPILEIIQQQIPADSSDFEKCHYLHKILIANVNNSIAMLHMMGCPLGATLTLGTNKNIQQILEKFQNELNLAYIETRRTNINYEWTAILVLQLNQTILKAVKIIRSAVQKNVNEHKWLYIHNKIR
jgi:hypothetical protein